MLQPINIHSNDLYKSGVSFKSMNNSINIEKAINGLNSIQGMKGSFSLQGKSLEKTISKLGDNGKKILEILSNNFKKPIINVAYKCSENGFTIGDIVIKDNKKQIGKGTVSVTNLGSPNSTIKYRFNIGEKGEVISSSGYIDNAEDVKFDSYESSLARKNGVYEAKLKIDNSTSDYIAINEKAFSDMLYKFLGVKIRNPLKECISNLMKDISNIQNFLRNLFSGKSVSLYQLKFFTKLIIEKDYPKIKKAEEKIPEAIPEKVVIVEKTNNRGKFKYENNIAEKLNKLNDTLVNDYEFYYIKINRRIDKPENEPKVAKCNNMEELGQRIEEEINTSAALIRRIISEGKKHSNAIVRYKKYIAYLMDLADIKGLTIKPHLSGIHVSRYRAEAAALDKIKKSKNVIVKTESSSAKKPYKTEFYYIDKYGKEQYLPTADILKDTIQREIDKTVAKIKELRSMNKGKSKEAVDLSNYVRSLRHDSDRNNFRLKNYGYTVVKDES